VLYWNLYDLQAMKPFLKAKERWLPTKPYFYETLKRSKFVEKFESFFKLHRATYTINLTISSLLHLPSLRTVAFLLILLLTHFSCEQCHIRGWELTAFYLSSFSEYKKFEQPLWSSHPTIVGLGMCGSYQQQYFGSLGYYNNNDREQREGLVCSLV
jgi:hypothetical protein